MKKMILNSLALMAFFVFFLSSCEENVDLLVPCDNGNLLFEVSYDTTAGLSVTDISAGNTSVPLSDFDVTIDGQSYSSSQLQNFSPAPATTYTVCASYIPDPSCSECLTFVSDSISNPTGGNNGGGNNGGGNNGGGNNGGGNNGGGSVNSSDCGTIFLTAAINPSGLSSFMGILDSTMNANFSWTLNGVSVGSGSDINLQVGPTDEICATYDCGSNMISQSCFIIP